MKIFAPILIWLACLTASAADRITATISVTNAPLGNTNTITINSNTRRFTNSVTASPATLIQQTNSIPWTATNLLNQLTDYRVSQFHFLSQTASSNVVVTGTAGEVLTVTLAGGWGFVTYSTQAVTTPTATVRVPMSVEFDSNRIRIASQVVTGIDDYATNAFKTNAGVLANFITKGASPLQTISSPLMLPGGLSGVITRTTNGYNTNGIFDFPRTTNLVNYGAALRSEGTGGNSFQAGSNALAVGSLSLAVGNGALASNTTTLAIGTESKATNNYSMAIGNGAIAGGVDTFAVGRGAQAYESGAMAVGQAAIAQGTGAVAVQSEVTGNSSIGIGASSSVTATNSTVIGPGATSLYNDSSAFGKNATTTTTNQIRLGTSSETVSIPGVLEAASSTNGNWTGTNTLNGRLDVPPRSNTGLANGYNSGVIFGTNYHIKFSGPSAAYTNAGFAAPGGPQMVWASFDNPGLSFTLLNESGIEATAANRIITETGALMNSTNRVVHGCFLYDTTSSRWRVLSFR